MALAIKAEKVGYKQQSFRVIRARNKHYTFDKPVCEQYGIKNELPLLISLKYKAEVITPNFHLAQSFGLQLLCSGRAPRRVPNKSSLLRIREETDTDCKCRQHRPVFPTQRLMQCGLRFSTAGGCGSKLTTY
ncbi:hypothetical protein J6590_009666 [Homalodisca vitripennis]|nr:hypothetical protein J6590_009666 [Homalodisca vitripennis]